MSDNGNHKSMLTSIKSFLRLRHNNSLKESVEEIIEEYDSGEGVSSEDGEKTMLRNVLTFSELNVEDVMIPHADINGVESRINYSDLKKIIIDKAHTRLPVFQETLDDIVGFIHIKDLLTIAYDESKKFDISRILRQCLFVPPSMKTSALLIKMQLSHVHIAIVVDEYGGTCGLVTLEDLMEEIVGEIEDEHDVIEDSNFKQISTDIFEANARIDIEELEQELDVKLYNNDEDADFETLGGLIFHILGRVPALGEIATMKCADNIFSLEFEISDADPRKVKKAIIRKKYIENDETV